MYSVEETTSMLSDIYDFELAAGPIYENVAIAEHYYRLTGNSEFVTEGFSDMVASITNVFKKLIDKIIKFFKDILRAITSHSMNLKDFVKKYKDELSNLHDVDFEYTGYDFGVLKSKKPNMSAFQQIVQSYNGAIAIVDSLTKEHVNDQRIEWFKSENLDKLRADILGTSTPIRADNFADEIQKYYRGDTEAKPIRITNASISEIINHVDDLCNSKRSAVEDRDKIIRLLNQAEVFFSRKVDTVYKGMSKVLMFKTLDIDQSEGKLSEDETTTTDPSYLKNFQNMVSFKYDQTKTISVMITQVISERAKALAAQIKQERSILGKALTNGKTDSNIEESTVVTELFGFGKSKNNAPKDSPDDHIKQEDYDRIIKTYKSKKTLPPSTGIDSAAWIICDYKLSDLDKFCNEKDTKLFIDIMTSECASRGRKHPVKPGPKSVVRFYSNDVNVDFFYCKDNKKIYGVYDDFSDFAEERTSSLSDLRHQVELELEYIGIYYTSVYKPTTEEHILFETKQIWMEYYREHIIELTDQSRNILTAIETGNSVEPVTEGALRTLIDKIKEILNRIIDLFRGKMDLRNEQYGPWINDREVANSIKNSLDDFNQPLSMVPFWDGNDQADFQKLSSMLNTVNQNLQKLDDPTWFDAINAFTDASSIDDIKERDYEEELRNYFRNGDKSGKKIEPVTLDEKNIDNVIPKMINYCQNFKSTINKIGGLESRVNALDVEETTEWLDVEHRPVMESSISHILNGVINSKPKYVSEANDDTANDTKTENPTRVQIIQDKEQKAGKETEQDAKNSINSKTRSSNDDMNFALRYTQSVVREYCRVCEERYSVYIKTLLRICPMEVYPMFENGKYIGIKRTVNKSKKKKSTSESVEYKFYRDKSTKGLDLFKG